MPIGSSANSTSTAPLHIAVRRGFGAWCLNAVRTDGSTLIGATSKVVVGTGSDANAMTSRSCPTLASAAGGEAGAGDDGEAGAGDDGAASFSSAAAVHAALTGRPAVQGVMSRRARICATL